MDWLIVNILSGSGRARAIQDSVRARFKEHAVLCEEKMAETIPEIQDIAAKAVQSGVDRLWVLGGDGTLAAVAGSLCYSRTALCPLPGGTVNVFCRELAVPLSAPEAVSALLAGECMSMDVGETASTKFLLMASVGIDARTVRDVNLNLKGKIGPLAYLIEGVLKFFTFPVCRLTVTDEHGIDRVGYHLIVQNSRLYGGTMVMAPKARLDDGRFDVILLKAPGRLAFLRFLFAIPSGRHVGLPYVEYFRSTTVQVKSSDTDSLQADGDCLTRLPAKITILPKALTVLAPRRPAL